MVLGVFIFKVLCEIYGGPWEIIEKQGRNREAGWEFVLGQLLAFPVFLFLRVFKKQRLLS